MITKVQTAPRQNENTPTFDPIRFKNGQRQEWDKVAAGWQQWWPLFEKGAQPLSERLVSLANIQPEHHVLDVATGVGEPALTAVKQLNSSDQITAIDQSSQMLAIAKDRFEALGFQQPNLVEMDAEQLNFSQSQFNAILSRFGLMFLPNLDDALVKMHQMLAPQGRLVTAVWDVPSKVPMLSLPMRVVRQHLELPPPPAGVPNPFNLANVSSFEDRLRKIGFTDIYSERMTLTWEFESADEFVNMTRDLAAPVTALLANCSSEQKATIWNGIADAVMQYADENGRIFVPSEAICVVGHRK